MVLVNVTVVRLRRKCRDTFSLQTKNEVEYDGELWMNKRTKESWQSSDDDYGGSTTVGRPEQVYFSIQEFKPGVGHVVTRNCESKYGEDTG